VDHGHAWAEDRRSQVEDHRSQVEGRHNLVEGRHDEVVVLHKGLHAVAGSLAAGPCLVARSLVVVRHILVEDGHNQVVGVHSRAEALHIQAVALHSPAVGHRNLAGVRHSLVGVRHSLVVVHHGLGGLVVAHSQEAVHHTLVEVRRSLGVVHHNHVAVALSLGVAYPLAARPLEAHQVPEVGLVGRARVARRSPAVGLVDHDRAVVHRAAEGYRGPAVAHNHGAPGAAHDRKEAVRHNSCEVTLAGCGCDYGMPFRWVERGHIPPAEDSRVAVAHHVEALTHGGAREVHHHALVEFEASRRMPGRCLGKAV